MITLFAYLLVMIGAFNWFCIGVLQFDFVAGMFGSQANIFSRLVYAIIGFSAVWLIYATIKSKGKIMVNGKRKEDQVLIGKVKNKLNKDDNSQEKQDNKDPLPANVNSQQAFNNVEFAKDTAPHNNTQDNDNCDKSAPQAQEQAHEDNETASENGDSSENKPCDNKHE